MQKAGKNIFFFILLITTAAQAQNVDVIKNYINTFKDLAIEEMQRTGIPASITLAQGIHESGAGMSQLAKESNNHFGIKCKSSWTGETVKHDDDARGECFRKYPSAGDSYKDHSDFLKNSERYASLFSLDPTDYEGWSAGLKKAGYATNPKYPQVLIKLIEDYQLQDFTLIALGKMPVEGFSSGKDSGKVSPETSSSPASNAEPVIPGKKISSHKVYPDGIFRINETKVVYVKKGTSYFAIAKQYDIDLAKIFEFNEIPVAEETGSDQLVYLQRKRKTGTNKFHLVLPGESLHDIAQEEGIRMESLMELNGLKDDIRIAGMEKLFLQTKSANKTKPAAKGNYSTILVTGDQHRN